MLAAAPARQALNPNPPAQPVKLIFIHHSTGENWLTDGYGDLGRTLGRNNYFVSDTNYGWGPDAIGDRTDIPDWVEWFSSGQTERYMQALLNENGQHSSYTRSLPDPGGENQVILFKSCFPNSALSGGPNDPPGTYPDMSISGAKYVYNNILRYFANRPDKLFIVITAPPLSDPAYAANARAFNQWLVNDWLAEYPLSNVAVFDFYNVLTGSGHHHRYASGQIEHTFNPGANTLAYPSGDDHPSEAGSRKATEDFVPLLNVYYNRWKADAAPGPLPPPVQNPDPAAGQPPSVPLPPVSLGLLDDFEGGIPAGTSGWEAYRDEAASTRLTCAPSAEQARRGAQSMRLDFDIAPGSWATCALMFDQPQDWSAADSLAFSLFSGSAGLVFNVDVYAGPPEARETYLYTIETSPVTSETWVPFELRWDGFHRADWEENAGAPFAKPGQVTGIAFGFTTYVDTPNTGVIWVDELHLSSREQAGVQPEPQAQPQPVEPQPEQPGRRLPFCGGALVLPLLLALLSRQFLSR
jgi:hypothetical protein